MAKKKFITSGIGRFASLGKSLTKATGHMALDKVKSQVSKVQKSKEKVDEWHRKALATKELVQSMGELKGALMKLGQMISITEDLILPPEISTLFSELQKNAPAMSEKEVNQVFIDSFGKGPEEIYEYFDPEPMAAASIGQVHRAKLKSGEEVAVKVQYPKIADAIKSDFKNLDALKKVVTILFPKTPNIDTYLKELKRSLEDECDYEIERDNLLFFKENCQRFESIVIPKVYPEFSSKFVLTMEYLEGDDFVDTKDYSQEDKDALGQLIYDFHNFCFYELGTVHADPQYGNYLFKKDKIILLDFGSIRKFPDEFVQNYIDLLMAIADRDLEKYKSALLKFGFFEEEDEDSLFSDHLHMIHDLYSPFNRVGKHKVPERNPMDLLKGFVDKIDLKGRKSPREEFLLLDRAHLGLYTKIRQWNAQIDWVGPKLKGWKYHEKIES